MEEVRTIRRGCPICRNNVTGTPRGGYFCDKCNFLFSAHMIDRRVEHKRRKSIIDKHFG